MKFDSIPGRMLLDTCILNVLQDEGAYIFEGEMHEFSSKSVIHNEIEALRYIFQVNQRASFQFLVSPLTFAELANTTDINHNYYRIKWALDVLDVWLTNLEETRDRKKDGGSVQHRFKLVVYISFCKI